MANFLYHRRRRKKNRPNQHVDKSRGDVSLLRFTHPLCQSLHSWKRCTQSILPSVSHSAFCIPLTHLPLPSLSQTLPPSKVKQLEWINGFGEEQEERGRGERREERRGEDRNREVMREGGCRCHGGVKTAAAEEEEEEE